MSFSRYAEYVDSGVDWLGEIPSHWRLTRVRFICKITTGDKDTQDAEPVGTYPFFVRSKNVERSDDWTYDGEGVLTAGDGDIGKIFHYHVGKCAIHQRVYLFYRFNSVSGRFFFRFISSQLEPVVVSQSAKSTVDSLRLPMLQNLWITLPPEDEQTQIARFLDHETAKIDALIAEQKRLIKLLQEKRQAVISHAVTKGLDPNVPMKDSGVEWLGEVPAHWKVIPLKNTIDSIKSGTSVNASDVPASDGEFGVLKTSCVYSGEFRAKENKTVLAEELSRLSCPVQVGTLIVSRMNTPDLVGAAGLVEVRVDNIFLPDRLWSVSFNETALPKYVYYWTRSESYRLQIKMVCAGTSSSMQNIGQDDFRSFSIALPPLAEQQLISSSLDDKLASFRLLTDSAGRAVELLMERRSALISAAVTGKIDVRDWQPPADESAFDKDLQTAGLEASA